MFTAIDHPAIACDDVNAMVAWYTTHLGMKLIASNGQNPPAVLVGYGDVKGGAVFELMPAKDRSPKPADVPRLLQGIRHVAIRVTDFDAAYAKLKSAGVVFLMEPTQAVGGGKIVSFRDPEGNELQIVQR